MTTFQYFMWAACVVVIIIIFKFWIFPFLKTKWVIWRTSLFVRKMARKATNPESKERLTKTADKIDFLRKNMKLGDE